MHVKSKIASSGNKIEKYIEYLTYAMILLFYTGKVFQIFTVVIDILFLTLLYVKQDKAFIKEYRVLILLWSGFFVYLFIQSLFASHVVVALENSVGMIRFVVLFFALVYVFNAPQKIKKLLYSVLLVIVLLFIDSFYQYVTGADLFGYPSTNGYRLTAWDSRPKLATFIAVFAGVAAASIVVLKNRWIGWIALLIVLMMVAFSGSKGPILYLGMSAFVVFLFSKQLRKYIIPSMALLGAVLVLALAGNQNISARFSQFKDPLSAANTSGRNQIYEAALEMVKKNPLLGVGGKNFRYEFPEYYLRVYEKKKNPEYFDKVYLKQVPTHTHSVLLSMLLNWGVIGTLLFFYILYHIYRKYIRNNTVALLASIGLLYCIAPFNFGNTVARSQWQFFIFLTLAFVMILGQYANRQVHSEAKG